MDVTVETSHAIPSLSQSLSTSPTGSRKRSFQEIDDGPAELKKTQKPSDGEVKPSTETPDANQSGAVADGPATSTAPDNVTAAPVDAAKETTPVSSVLTVLSTPNMSPPAAPSMPQQSTTPGNAAAATNKKRKLSPASKEAKRLEKEAKERQKIEEKAKKEEEKRAKEEEKKKREAEREEERKKREERRKAKEEEKAAKEEEKRKKEEEKLKKERVSYSAFLSRNGCGLSSRRDADLFSGTNEIECLFRETRCLICRPALKCWKCRVVCRRQRQCDCFKQ